MTETTYYMLSFSSGGVKKPVGWGEAELRNSMTYIQFTLPVKTSSPK